MLDQTRSEIRVSQFLSSGISSRSNGFFSTDPSPPDYFQVAKKNNTVKELLMMSRQKRNCSQDDDNSEHKCKSPKFEACPSDTSSHLLSPSAPVNPGIDAHFLSAAPENGHFTPQQKQYAALQGQMAMTAEVKMTLFQWQIQQEAQRFEGVSSELMNMQDADGDTFLHIAVAQGKRALAYVLAAKMVKSGSLDMKEHNGQTALQIAAATNQHLIVHDLLVQGAQINTRDLWGRSPLHVCAEKGYFQTLQSIWSTLLGSEQQIDIEMFNYDGLTPLHTAVLSHNSVVKELRSLENTCSYMARELVQKRQTYVQCIKTLLHMGASYGTKDLKSGRTCLHMASEEANVELLNICFEQPSSLTVVNVKMFSGNTALHIVSSLQNHKTQVEALKLLMRKGADPGARNFENELPSQLVPEGPIGEMVRQILKGKYVHA
ncbi:hypothetical protein PAMP_016552 [Pampus punctatissimus]